MKTRHNTKIPIEKSPAKSQRRQTIIAPITEATAAYNRQSPIASSPIASSPIAQSNLSPTPLPLYLEQKPALPITHRLTHTKIMSQYSKHPQCAELDGKYYYIKINAYNNKKLIDSLPLLKNPTHLEPGLYTYIVMSVGYEPVALYMIKTITIYEYGTKHHNMIHRIACAHDKCTKHIVYYAGEAQVSNDNVVQFNFYSGTYMMNPDKTKHRLTDSQKQIASEHFSGLLHGYSIHYVDSVLLTSDVLPISRDDLNVYKNMDAKIMEFDDLTECRKHHEIIKLNKRSVPNPSSSRQYGGNRYRRRTRRF